MNKKRISISLRQKGFINGKREEIYVDRNIYGLLTCGPAIGSLYEVANYIYNEFSITFDIIVEKDPIITLDELEDYLSKKYNLLHFF